MKNSSRFLLIVLLPALILAGVSYLRADEKFDVRSLEGDWEGTGEFLVPATGITMSVEGKARFEYDSLGDYVRTAMVGEKFFFSYSDSGHLIHDSRTDSVSWEVWDNFGKHALYFGEVDGNTIRADRYRKDDLYQVRIELVNADSIDFKLTVTKPKGTVVDKASFNLWRVKE